MHLMVGIHKYFIWGVVTVLYPYYNDILFTVSCYNFSKNACIVVLYLYLCILVWYLKKSICTQRSLVLIGDAPWNVELIFIEEIAVKVRQWCPILVNDIPSDELEFLVNNEHCF